MLKTTYRERFLGSLLGLSIGDALGAPIEFLARDTYIPITGYRSGGPFHLAKGQWTDDTSLALCLGKSLLEKNKFDAEDIMNRFHQWFRHGYMSCTGNCFDIGNTTKAALLRFEEKHDLFSGSPEDPPTNGSIMRLTPIPLFYFHHVEEMLFFAKESSRLTHAPRECLDACSSLTLFIHRALQGQDKAEILNFKKGQLDLCPTIENIMLGSFKSKSREEISALGLATSCLEAALWAFYQTDNFNDGVLLAANLGEDSDTTAAVFGQLAGAYYGVNAIRSDFREELWDNKKIEIMAIELYKKVNPYFYEGENPTVDLIVINPKNEILLIKRSLSSQACPGMMAFPGGFIDSKAAEGSYWESGLETPGEAAIRELHEETNLKLETSIKLEFIGEYVGHNRDPRDSVIAWSKSHVFSIRIDEKTFNEQQKFIRGSDDAILAKWIPLKEARSMTLAFDHNLILEDAAKNFCNKLRRRH